MSVDYVTLELDESEKTAIADEHFEFAKKTATFEHGENELTIKVKLFKPQDAETEKKWADVDLSFAI